MFLKILVTALTHSNASQISTLHMQHSVPIWHLRFQSTKVKTYFRIRNLFMRFLVSVASLVLLQHNTVVYQRQIGRHVRCASFSPNSKQVNCLNIYLKSNCFRYLAFGLDGVVSIYAVDQKGLSAEPLRLLQRRYFGNVASESAITSVEWSPDSKLLLTTSQSHVMKVYAPLSRSARFRYSTLTDTAEIVGAFFKDDNGYDVSQLF